DQKAGFRFSINWGDASASTEVGVGVKTASHVYATSNTFTITVTAFDKDSTPSGSTTRTMVISDFLTQPDPDGSGRTALIVGGTAEKDRISLVPGASGGVDLKFGDSQVGNTFNPTGRIIVFGQAGDDTISIDPALDRVAEFHGGAGKDTLTGGRADDVLLRHADDDVLAGHCRRGVLNG